MKTLIFHDFGGFFSKSDTIRQNLAKSKSDTTPNHSLPSNRSLVTTIPCQFVDPSHIPMWLDSPWSQGNVLLLLNFCQSFKLDEHMKIRSPQIYVRMLQILHATQFSNATVPQSWQSMELDSGASPITCNSDYICVQPKKLICSRIQSPVLLVYHAIQGSKLDEHMELNRPWVYIPGVFGGGVGTLVDVSQSFCKLVDVFFPKNGDFFEIFEMNLPTTPQKSLFIAFLLTNFPKISKKVLKNFQVSKEVLKNFSRCLRHRENPLFSNPPWQMDTPPWSGQPPNTPAISLCYFC